MLPDRWRSTCTRYKRGAHQDGTIGAGTYWFRVQAIASTEIGKFVVAQTDPIQYAVP
jgi:hypothetical protein